MTKIKLCGLTRPEDIAAANELQPEYIGFIFWDKSRRYVTKEKAKELKGQLSDNIKAVGVFVDGDVNTIVSYLDEGIIDAVQLHGNEDEAYIARLMSLTTSTIIKAYKIKASDDIVDATWSVADIILLDSGMGSGLTFDWELMRSIKKPYFLAGGLDCDNIEEAIREYSPYGVDVSSGIETDGVKDPEKMRTFVEKVRNFDRTDQPQNI